MIGTFVPGISVISTETLRLMELLDDSRRGVARVGRSACEYVCVCVCVDQSKLHVKYFCKRLSRQREKKGSLLREMGFRVKWMEDVKKKKAVSSMS